MDKRGYLCRRRRGSRRTRVAAAASAKVVAWMEVGQIPVFSR